jgi:dethiobiotin synthetase
MSVLVVTGTDTGVGKTIVCAALCAITGATYVKAAQTGGDDDAAEVARLAGAETHVLARFADPLAPASAGEGITADEVVTRMRGLSPHSRLVEGAGGLLVRLGADGSTLADVAAKLGAPVLVVARPGLGTLNHTALTVEALRARGLACPGVVIGSWPDDPGLAERRNLDDLPAYAGVPLLGRVPAGAGRMDPAEFRARAPTWIAAPGAQALAQA